MIASYIKCFSEGDIEDHKEGSRFWIRDRVCVVCVWCVVCVCVCVCMYVCMYVFVLWSLLFIHLLHLCTDFNKEPCATHVLCAHTTPVEVCFWDTALLALCCLITAPAAGLFCHACRRALRLRATLALSSPTKTPLACVASGRALPPSSTAKLGGIYAPSLWGRCVCVCRYLCR